MFVKHVICTPYVVIPYGIQSSCLQEMVAVQTELDASQRDLRKAQQLLRQLERQLAKSHVSRKDSATISQQMQVSNLWCRLP